MKAIHLFLLVAVVTMVLVVEACRVHIPLPFPQDFLKLEQSG